MDNDLKEYMLYEEEYRHFLKKNIQIIPRMKIQLI